MAENAANPEEDANTLFIEATQLYKEAQGTEKTNSQRAIALYRDVQKKLQVILEKYASTQMGAQLADGQLRIGKYTARDFEEAVLQPMEKKAASESDPFSCAFLVIERIDDPGLQMGVLNNAARRYGDAGFKKESLGILGGIEKRIDTVSDSGSRAQILIDTAAVLIGLGQADAAVRVLGRAQGIAAVLDDPNVRAKRLYDIASTFAMAGAYDRAYGIAAGMSNPAGKSVVLVALADQYIKSGRPADAKKILDEAYQVSIVIPDNYQRALGWCEIADRYARIGDKKKAVEMLDAVHGWGRLLTLKEYQLSVMADLAAKYAMAGESKKAIDIVQQACQTVNAIKDRLLKVENTLKLSDTYRELGMGAKAEELLMYAYGEAGFINDPLCRSASVAEIADRFSALKQCNRAMEIVQGIQDPVPKVIASLKVVAALEKEGDSERARTLLTAARTDAANVKDRNGRDALLIDITERFAEIGRWQEAFETVPLIEGKPARALALLRLGSACAKAGYVLQGNETNVLRRVVQDAQ